MNQPDLGRKIAELRKAKGLTQEELVEICNLSVRTIQRIESGEVMPRSYTLRIIFSALDYTILGSLENTLEIHESMESKIKKWLEQISKYVIDLFNLKTNTMKKIMILSVPFLSVCLVLLFSSLNSKAINKEKMLEKFEKNNGHFSQWFNSGQIDSIGFTFLENACMMPDKLSPITGRENIKEYYRQLYLQGFRFLDNRTISLVITDSIIVERGSWSVSINPLMSLKGSYLTQWHNIDGQWLIENEMSKTDEIIIPEEKKE